MGISMSLMAERQPSRRLDAAGDEQPFDDLGQW
jgi:hypothetical protein